MSTKSVPYSVLAFEYTDLRKETPTINVRVVTASVNLSTGAPHLSAPHRQTVNRTYRHPNCKTS